MNAGRWLCIGITVLGFLLSAREALAAEKKFPTRPIQVVITFAPGATDLLMRPFIEKLPDYLGQPVTFVYKPGAGGSLGAGFVADSKPDGYTLVGSSPSAILVIPMTQKDLRYSLQSFVPICCLCADTLVFAVQSDSPWKSMKDFVEAAKRSPGQITYSSSGRFAIPHLSFEAFSREAGIKLNYIPSQGGGPAVTALLGGHVQAYSGPMPPPLPHLTMGTLRGLALTAEKRLKILPDIPTLAELGYRLRIPTGYGLLAPKGTPKEVTDAIYMAAKKVVENHSDSITERLEKLGAVIKFLGPEEYTAQLAEQQELYSKILSMVRQAN